MRNNQKGFSLIEIMVFLIFLCISGALIYGTYRNISKHKNVKEQSSTVIKAPLQSSAADSQNYYLSNQAHKNQILSEQKQIDEASGLTNTLNVLQNQLTPYGLIIESSPTSGISFTPLQESDTSNLKSFGKFLVDELARYPNNFFATIGIKYVNLSNGPATSNSGKTESEGLADITNDTVFYDVQGTPGPHWSRGTIEHEIGHFTAHYLGYLSGETLSSWQSWIALNPTDFNYTLTCLSLHPVASINLRAGFASPYAMTCPAEDWAETYSEAIIDNPVDYARDTVLTAKVAFVKSNLLARQPSWSNVFGPQ